MNKVAPLRHWKYWFWRLAILYLMVLLTCVLGFPVLIYLVAPFTAWVTADISYTWPTAEQLMKWVRYGLWCTFSVGTISWLGELIPWLMQMRRDRNRG